MRDEKAVYEDLKQEIALLLQNPRFTPSHMDFYTAAINDVTEIIEQKIAKEGSGEHDDEQL